MKSSFLLALGLVLLSAGAALAHFPILLPLTPWGTHGQALELVYSFGHPFEVENVAAARPLRLLSRGLAVRSRLRSARACSSIG